MLTPEQQSAIDSLYEANRLIVCPMGGGKTVIAATAISELISDNILSRVLIVTTPKIANGVWAQEFKKWQHTAPINVAVATGNPSERLTVINGPAVVVVISFNTLPWMKDRKLFGSFDGLLIDETTKLKTTGGAQFKALRPQIKNFKWRAGLTGTPTSENFEQLYAQIMLIDNGKALGTRKDKFLSTYFIQKDYRGYQYELAPGAGDRILRTIDPLVHVVPDYRDTLPPIEYKNYLATPPENVREYYSAMEKDFIVGEVVAPTAAVLVQKLQQISSGFVYTPEGTEILSDYRIHALKEILNGVDSPALVVYWYQEDLKRIKEAIPAAGVLDKKDFNETVKAWNQGKIDTLLIHPRAAGHGLQLEQGGRHIIWFTPQWSNDLWHQTNARLWRKGQHRPVVVWSIIARDTIEQAITNRIEGKNGFNEMFNNYFKEQKCDI